MERRVVDEAAGFASTRSGTGSDRRLTWGKCLLTTAAMTLSYLKDLACFESYRLTLTQSACPQCHAVGFLIRHGFLLGYGFGSEIIQRGWRIFCSNRQRRRGCGRTHALLIAKYIYRRSVTTSTVTGFLKNLLTGFSLAQAWPVCAQSIECARQIWRAWKRSQTRIRSLLCSLAPAALSHQSNPFVQTLEHLFNLFGSVSHFQLHFQKALL